MSENIEEKTSTTIKRTSKYSTEEERHEAIKSQKRNWYYLNKDKQKLKSLKTYYQKQLQKQELKPDIRSKYETKLNEIETKLKQ